MGCSLKTEERSRVLPPITSLVKNNELSAGFYESEDPRTSRRLSSQQDANMLARLDMSQPPRSRQQQSIWRNGTISADLRSVNGLTSPTPLHDPFSRTVTFRPTQGQLEEGLGSPLTVQAPPGESCHGSIARHDSPCASFGSNQSWSEEIVTSDSEPASNGRVKIFKKKIDKNNREKESRANLSKQMAQLERFLLEEGVIMKKGLSESNKKTAGHSFKKDEILNECFDYMKRARRSRIMTDGVARESLKANSIIEKDTHSLKILELNALNRDTVHPATGILSPEGTPPR